MEENSSGAGAPPLPSKHTPGPWPWQYTSDRKRIVIGAGLVEGPNGYEVAEVYSDDCPSEVAEANARLIAAAPDLLEAVRAFVERFDSGQGRRAYTDHVAGLMRSALAKAESR